MASGDEGKSSGGGGAASSSSCVYVHDKIHGWLPANVISTSEDGKTCDVHVHVPSDDEGQQQQEEGSMKVETRTIKLSEYENKNLPLQNVDANGCLIPMADMCDLPSLHEAAILYNLKHRYEGSKQQSDEEGKSHVESEGRGGGCLPYTRVGDIVIAVNPFQWIPYLYAEATREKYADQLVWNAKAGEGDPKVGLDPHVYEASAGAYRGLAVDGQDQSILVSGESGAGKTESVKIVMKHLASIHDPDSSNDDGDGGGVGTTHDIVKRVLDSSPLLEAFGNAKTVRNDNSSRFGKYTQLQFDVEDAQMAQFQNRSVPTCVLAGSYCETYLLEKSRVTGHETSERTYHIFYQLLSAPNDVKHDIWAEGLDGSTYDSFKFVGATDTLLIEGQTDEQKWHRTVEALQLVGVKDDVLKHLMRAVAMVMQLGNIVFEESQQNEDVSVITSTVELQNLSDVTGIPLDEISKALTTRSVVAGGQETYIVPLNARDAKDACDAFAKEIYHQIFDWLVNQINQATSAEANYQGGAGGEGEGRNGTTEEGGEEKKEVPREFGIIGLLDIFGFESFVVNRFEQLCINYTNEKLQQKYISDVFRSVTEEYEYEGIGDVKIEISDNADVLKLIEGRMGELDVLNEECVRPRGNDESFVSKVKTMNKDSDYLLIGRLDRPNEFAIQHYAGGVKYDASNFIQKNMDNLPMDLLKCSVQHTTNLVLQSELRALLDAKEAAANAKGGRKASSLTIVSKFKRQLNHLMENVSKTRTRYIRCIKPNKEKVPLRMELKMSVEQLRCAGIVAAVTITRVAFPNRLMHETVLERFRVLLDDDLGESQESEFDESKEEAEDEKKETTTAEDEEAAQLMKSKQLVEKMLDQLLKSLETQDETTGEIVKSFVVGKTRVYFRRGALEYLETKRVVALGVVATSIQRFVRGYLAKSHYWLTMDATIMVQALVRSYHCRSAFLQQKMACITLECWYRCYTAKAILVSLRRNHAACIIQSSWRRDRAVRHLKACLNAAIAIERIARGAIQRPLYRLMVKEAADEARVNEKIAALQKRLQDAERKWITAEKQRLEAEKRAEAGGGGGAGTGEPVIVEKVVTVVKTVVSGEEEEEEGGEEKKMDGAGLSSLNKALLDESTEMLEFLKKDNFNIKAKNFLLRNDLEEMKVYVSQMEQHNAALQAALEMTKQTSNQCLMENEKLSKEVAKEKEVAHLAKQELKQKNYEHLTELSKVMEDHRKKDALYKSEIARLKKIVGEPMTPMASPTAAGTTGRTNSNVPPMSPNRGGGGRPRIVPIEGSLQKQLQQQHQQQKQQQKDNMSQQLLPQSSLRRNMADSSGRSTPTGSVTSAGGGGGGGFRSGSGVNRQHSHSNAFRRTLSYKSIESLDKWGHDGYYATARSETDSLNSSQGGTRSYRGGGGGRGGKGGVRRPSNIQVPALGGAEDGSVGGVSPSSLANSIKPRWRKFHKSHVNQAGGKIKKSKSKDNSSSKGSTEPTQQPSLASAVQKGKATAAGATTSNGTPRASPRSSLTSSLKQSSTSSSLQSKLPSNKKDTAAAGTTKSGGSAAGGVKGSSSSSTMKSSLGAALKTPKSTSSSGTNDDSKGAGGGKATGKGPLPSSSGGSSSLTKAMSTGTTKTTDGGSASGTNSSLSKAASQKK